MDVFWRDRLRVLGDPPRRDSGDARVEAAVEPERRLDAPHEDNGSSILDTESLTTAFKWTAAGFTAVVGVLGFFGLKDGSLDQALRLYAPATLCIFVFLGIGVVSALFAPAIKSGSRLRVWALIAALLVMLLSAAVFFPDISQLQSRERQRLGLDEPAGWLQLLRPWLAVVLAGLFLVMVVRLAGRAASSAGPAGTRQRVFGAIVSVVLLAGLIWAVLPRSFDPITGEVEGIDQRRVLVGLLATALFLGLLGVLAWSLVKMTAIPTIAGLVVIAVAATSLGLYGATKLAVESKSFSVLPQVVAKMQDASGSSAVQVSVKAGRFRGHNLIVQLQGVPRPPAARTLGDEYEPTREKTAVIWATLLRPDALDEIDQTINVPIAPTRWKGLTVRYCSVSDEEVQTPECAADADTASVVSLRNRAPEPGLEQITAQISPASDGEVRASFNASDVAPGLLTKVELCRTHKGKHTTHVTDATLSPDEAGAVKWDATVPAGVAGDRLLLRHASCSAGTRCRADWRTIASYTTE